MRVLKTSLGNPQFSFFSDVEIGKDVTLTSCAAVMTPSFWRMERPVGAKLSSQGRISRTSLPQQSLLGWYNGHPNYVNLPVRLDCETAVVVGHGNVAIDVTRILLSDVDRLAKTDIADHALRWYGKARSGS